MDILKILVKKGILLQKDTEEILKESEESGLSIDDVLIKRNISAEDILSAKGDYYDIPVKTITEQSVPPSLLAYVPEDSATHYRFIPIGVTDGVLEIGMVNPDDIEARDAINFIASKVGMPFKIFLITQADFAKVFSLYKGFTNEVSKSLSELEMELKADVKNQEAVKNETKNYTAFMVRQRS